MFISALSAACIIITIIALINNYPLYFIHFLIFPVAAVSYIYPKKGMYFAGTIGIIYLLFYSLKAGEPDFTPLKGTVYVFFIVVLSIIVSFISYTTRESEREYLQVINDQSELISRVLPDGRLKIANDAFCSYYGIKKCDINKNRLKRNIHPEDSEKFQDALDSLSADNPVTNIEVRQVTGSGEIRWQNMNIRSIFDKRGLLKEYQFVSRDITETKLFEKKLQDKVNYVSALMDSIPAPVFYRDTKGVYYDCNPAFEKLVGQKKNEIIGKNICDFFPKDLASVYSDKDNEIIQRPHLQQYEYIISDKAGRFHDVMFSKTARLDAEGTVTGIVGVALDITARKKAESELKRSLDEKTTLLQEVHHRVKNNLAVINAMLGMQMNDLCDKSLEGPLKDAKSRIISMALVHEELYKSENIAFIDAGSHFSLLLKELVANFAGGRDIKTNVAADKCFLSIDMAIPCSLIVNELVTNSLKYAFKNSDSGEISVSMKESDGFHTIKVSDDGIGIPAQFDIENTKSFGMKLVKNIIEYQMEGRIELESGIGTCWSITIPDSDK